MPRLFLASSFDKTIRQFVAKINSNSKRVAFIENASIPYEIENPFWVKSDYLAFIDNGFELEKVDMRDFQNKPETEVKKTLENFDIIHFCGGHTRYLLSQIHLCNFFNPVRELVLENKLIYTGTSAGSMTVAPEFNGLGRFDDDVDNLYLETIKPEHEKGLGLVDFLILPHFNNPEFIPSNTETIKQTNYKHPLLFLADNQAVWVEERRFEIINDVNRN